MMEGLSQHSKATPDEHCFPWQDLSVEQDVSDYVVHTKNPKHWNTIPPVPLTQVQITSAELLSTAMRFALKLWSPFVFASRWGKDGGDVLSSCLLIAMPSHLQNYWPFLTEVCHPQ